MKINEIGEFGLIGRIAENFRELIPAGWEGIGDDCAVIPWDEGQSMVVTTDLLVEDIHFLRDRITPYELGYKSLAVNLSDVAAMGAKPVATFLSIGLPAERIEVGWCDSFFEGYRSFGIPLLGGDTTSSPEGIIINITVLGMAENHHIKRRNAAKTGDIIAVTGPLGDSAGGLRTILDNLPLTTDNEELIRIHHTPRPHLAEGEWLGRQAGVRAMMDISDGVASDLLHILRASQLSAVIDISSPIPISPLLQRVATKNGWDMLKLALAGGEDYVLLLTVDPSQLDDIQEEFRTIFGHKLYAIGHCTHQTDTTPAIEYQGLTRNVEGFKHF